MVKNSYVTYNIPIRMLHLSIALLMMLAPTFYDGNINALSNTTQNLFKYEEIPSKDKLQLNFYSSFICTHI